MEVLCEGIISCSFVPRYPSKAMEQRIAKQIDKVICSRSLNLDKVHNICLKTFFLLLSSKHGYNFSV